jgi:hypothetical protein
MNKKFKILGVVMMILMASMAFVSCEIEATSTSGTTEEGKVVAQKYWGTWKVTSGSDEFILDKNTYQAGASGKVPAYTEGSELWYTVDGVDYKYGDFTDDTTFRNSNGLTTYKKQ